MPNLDQLGIFQKAPKFRHIGFCMHELYLGQPRQVCGVNFLASLFKPFSNLGGLRVSFPPSSSKEKKKAV